MGTKISREAKSELIEAIGRRYRAASKQEKHKILDEFVAIAGYHRKHAIRLLSNHRERTPRTSTTATRVYDEAVREALIVLWEASDRICGKRLKAALPQLVEAMERHNHLELDSLVRERVMSVSASTIDRLLQPVRRQASNRKKKRRVTKPSKKVRVRTFSDWDEPIPGFLEIDFVVQCGGSVGGSYVSSLVVTDVCSGWIEAVPLLAREQSLVVEGLGVIEQQLPMPIQGIDSDNDSAFINDTLVNYCEKKKIEFTRCRAYRKNDQAWIEQKNGAVIRKFVGHDRLNGVVAAQAMARLFQAMRMYVNFFQPSFKLEAKRRNGAKTYKKYYPPATPCDRLLEHDAIANETKTALRSVRGQLDPLALLYSIRESQEALAKLASGESAEVSGSETLSRFLEQLPHLWESGEARPTHRRREKQPRYWRTRKDPFESVWSVVLLWLQEEPDASAKVLFDRLCKKYPEHGFQRGQLRTLQRRVRKWRQVMAKQLVLGCASEN